MKLIGTTGLFTLLVGFAFAQTSNQTPEVKEETNKMGQTVQTIQASSFSITTPARTWPVIDDEPLPLDQRKKVRNDFERDGYLDAQNTVEVDPVRQDYQGTKQQRTPIINFAGQNGSGYPPDPSGAAGPNHYVQAVNSAYRIYNKTGASVAGPFSLSNIWPGQGNLGDPIVMYDRHADRWFISQFGQNPNKVLLAVSKTNDPTGQWYTYNYSLSQFPDYPKYSIWWDGYYMTSNSTHTAVVFEREKMIAGDPTAKMISLSLPSLNHGGFRSPLPADADGPLPPDGTPCYFFNLEDNAFSGVSQDQIEIYEMTTDWTTTSNTQVVSSQQLAVPSFDAVFTGGFSNISQPGTSQKLDVIQGVLMYRAQHMRWMGYNTIILSHAVDMGGNRSAIRWYELRDNNDGIWNVHQSSTYDPDNGSRWMSSAGMDNYGNIGMAYILCNASNNTYTSLRYTGRLGTDTPNEMSYMEQVGFNGSASQSGIDRFGDYAHLSLDPDGKTFWYTSEYIGGSGTSGSPRTRIISFSIEDETGLSENPYYDNLNMIAYQNGSKLIVEVEGINKNEDVEIQVISANGQVIYNSAILQPMNNKLLHQFNTDALSSSVYFVRVGNKNFQKVIKTPVQK
jgi:hypothetical protein